MNNFLHGVFLLLLMCYSSWIPSDFRNGFTFRDAAGLWKGEECYEESAYHGGKPREGDSMHAGSWFYAGVKWVGKKISKVSVGLSLNHTSIEPSI